MRDIVVTWAVGKRIEKERGHAPMDVDAICGGLLDPAEEEWDEWGRRQKMLMMGQSTRQTNL